jgi:hypothetical protein
MTLLDAKVVVKIVAVRAEAVKCGAAALGCHLLTSARGAMYGNL